MSAINPLNEVVQVHASGSSFHRQPGYTAFLAGLEAGRHLRASVQSRLPNGEFLVTVGAKDMADAQLLHMRLPADMRPGDALNLVFVSRNPRPTFMLMAEPSSAAVSVPLSETGRFISDLLSRSTPPGSLTTLSSTAPLLAAPPADGVQLAAILARTLGQSGLFYESHQAQWIAGKRPLAELLLEPQAPLFGLRARLPDPAAQSNASIMTGMARDNAADANVPVHPDTLALVRQQLEVFETRHITWQGVAWPGQKIEWEIFEEKPADTGEPGEFDESDEPGHPHAAWQTRLNLTMPNLGQVSASLRFDAHGVEIRLTTASPVTAFMLRAGATPLANGLDSAGISLRGMGVELDE
ncbi:MAG: flagellar hook-length control protein FliK [Nitrosospira sp.]